MIRAGARVRLPRPVPVDRPHRPRLEPRRPRRDPDGRPRPPACIRPESSSRPSAPSASTRRSAALEDAPSYLNAAARLSVDLPPSSLLTVLQQIERSAGRQRSADDRNAPRTLDLDLLLYGDLASADPASADPASADPALTLPHPRMHGRRFVLEPLAEISPRAVHPTTGLTIAALLAALAPPDAMLHSE